MRTIGIDLGGTKISAILWDGKRVLKKKTERTPLGTKKIFETMAEMAKDLGRAKRLGIGIPGIVQDGVVAYAPHVSLKGVNVEKELSRIVKMPVVAENDSNLFTLAEQRIGAAKSGKAVVGLIIGTGLSCGLVLNGQIYSGASGGAGEVGHTKMHYEGRLLEVEQLISGPALLSRYEQMTGEMIHTLGQAKGHGKSAILETLSYQTGILMAGLIDLLNPSHIVIGGGVSNLDFIEQAKKVAKEHSLAILYSSCTIARNTLGDDSGVIGAAMLAEPKVL